MICPFKLAAGFMSSCCGEDCAFYDEALDSCLVRTWLITQIENSPIQISKPKRTKEEPKLD